MPDEPRWRRYLRFWRTNLDQDIEDECGWTLRWDALAQDLRYAVRSLRLHPGLASAVVVTLALGVGAMVTMYAIVHWLVIAPPPHVADPARVGKLYLTVERPDAPPETFDKSAFPFLEVLRRDASSFEDVGAYMHEEVTVARGADAHLALAGLVSSGFWSALRTAPVLGRLIADEEAHPATGSRVAVLGYDYWRGRFGSDADAIGRTIDIKGNPYEIVGVAPRGFRGVDLLDVDLWLPLYAYADGNPRMRAWYTFPSFNLTFVARLRDGISTAQASAEASQLHDVFRATMDAMFRQPASPHTRWSTTLGPVTGALGTDMKRIPEANVAVWLVGVAALLLLLACANVATLLLLRALRRRHEIAIRLALGMSRARLAMLLFTESALLAGLGGMLAVVVVGWGGAAISRLLLPELPWDAAALDASTLGVGVACVVAASVLVSLAPVTQGWRDAMPALKDGGQQGATHRGGLQRALLVLQTGLSVVLLLGAGLFLRSLHEIDTLDLGMEVDDVLAISVDFASTVRNPPEVAAFYEQALERARAVPGVERASLARDIPLMSASGGHFQIAGRDSTFRIGDPVPMLNYVTPDFFATMGMRLVKGRWFEPHERMAAVAVINDEIARRFWPEGDAVGACIYASGPRQCTTIIGVVATARRFRLREPAEPTWYRPLSPDEPPRVLLVRAAQGTRELERRLRSTLQGLEPGLPYVNIRPVAAALDPQIRPWRLGASVFTAFGVLAALLVGIGLHSAVAYAAAARTKEIGLRLAIGARALDIILLVLGQAIVVAVLGIAMGAGLGLAAGRFVQPLLFDVSPRDALVFSSVVAIALLSSLAASLGPALGARRIDPATVLRVD